MSEIAEKDLIEVLAQFESSGQSDQAASICKRFLRKREILGQPEAQQSANVHAALVSRNRATLRDYAEFSQFADIRDMCCSLAGCGKTLIRVAWDANETAKWGQARLAI